MVTGNARCKSGEPTGIEQSHRYLVTVLKYKQLSRLGIRRFSRSGGDIGPLADTEALPCLFVFNLHGKFPADGLGRGSPVLPPPSGPAMYNPNIKYFHLFLLSK